MKLYDKLGVEIPLQLIDGVYQSTLSFDKVSTGLVECQTIYVKDTAADAQNGLKYLFFIDKREQTDFQVFTYDETQSAPEIVWKDRYEDTGAPNSRFNIGFCTETEGYYEEYLYVFRMSGDDMSLYAKILLKAEAEGEDERYRTLFTNFGIPDPIDYMKVFRDTDLDQPDIDNVQLNLNSKKMFLAYPDIFPYVGTYKALLGALRILGYDDIFFKEWYKHVDSSIIDYAGGKYIMYDMPYNIDGTRKEIPPMSDERRIQLKKLNWLSMFYKLSEETGEIFNRSNRVPIPESDIIHHDDINEFFLKLVYLKEWLERHILALNCRIIDIGAEGVVFERYALVTHGGVQISLGDMKARANLTPKVKYPAVKARYYKNEKSSAQDSIAEIEVILNLANSGLTFEDYADRTFSDFAEYYRTATGVLRTDVPNTKEEIEAQDGKETVMFPGATFIDPSNLYAYKLAGKAMVDNFYLYAGSPGYVSGCPLFIRNNQIEFDYTDPDISQESTFLNSPDLRLNSYNLYDKNGNFKKKVKDGYEITGTVKDVVGGVPVDINGDEVSGAKKAGKYVLSGNLMFTANDTWKKPVFMDNTYIIDIVDGDILLKDPVASHNRYVSIDITDRHNTNLNQTVKVNIVYLGPDKIVDDKSFKSVPVDYWKTTVDEFSDNGVRYHMDESDDFGADGNNTLLKLPVYNTGNVDLILYGFNRQNNIFPSKLMSATVICDSPDILLATKGSGKGPAYSNTDYLTFPVFKTDYIYEITDIIDFGTTKQIVIGNKSHTLNELPSTVKVKTLRYTSDMSGTVTNYIWHDPVTGLIAYQANSGTPLATVPARCVKYYQPVYQYSLPNMALPVGSTKFLRSDLIKYIFEKGGLRSESFAGRTVMQSQKLISAGIPLPEGLSANVESGTTLKVSSAYEAYAEYFVSDYRVWYNNDADEVTIDLTDSSYANIFDVIDSRFALSLNYFTADLWTDVTNSTATQSYKKVSVNQKVTVASGDTVIASLPLSDIDSEPKLKLVDGNYTVQWDVYKVNYEGDHTHMLSVYNKVLAIKPTDRGYYYIDASVYDIYGNKVCRKLHAAIEVL